MLKIKYSITLLFFTIFLINGCSDSTTKISDKNQTEVLDENNSTEDNISTENNSTEDNTLTENNSTEDNTSTENNSL